MTLLRVILLLALGLSASVLGALFLFQRHLIYPGAFGSGFGEGERGCRPGRRRSR